MCQTQTLDWEAKKFCRSKFLKLFQVQKRRKKTREPILNNKRVFWLEWIAIKNFSLFFSPIRALDGISFFDRIYFAGSDVLSRFMRFPGIRSVIKWFFFSVIKMIFDFLSSFSPFVCPFVCLFWHERFSLLVYKFWNENLKRSARICCWKIR